MQILLHRHILLIFFLNRSSYSSSNGKLVDGSKQKSSHIEKIQANNHTDSNTTLITKNTPDNQDGSTE